jgi:hypothetical protein
LDGVGSPQRQTRRRHTQKSPAKGVSTPRALDRRTSEPELDREATTPEQRAKAARFCSGPADADDIEMNPKRVGTPHGSTNPVTPKRRFVRKTPSAELHGRDEIPIASGAEVDGSLAAGSATRQRIRSKSPGRAVPSVLSSEEHVSRELHGKAATPSMEDVSTVPVAKAKPLLRLRRATGVNVSACSAPEIAAAVGAGLMSDGRDASSASAAAPSHAAGVAPGGPAASSASTAAPASALRRSSRLAASNARGQNVEGADASDTRAMVEAHRGIGNMSVAERMRLRSQARDQLDSAELRGRGRGRGRR